MFDEFMGFGIDTRLALWLICSWLFRSTACSLSHTGRFDTLALCNLCVMTGKSMSIENDWVCFVASDVRVLTTL